MPPTQDASRARDAAIRIVRLLRDAGHVAYFAGGCVRDELLGLTPADYDVATDATPQRIAELFRNTSEVGAAFGVMLVRLDGEQIEVATFRADGDYSDRRRPDRVHFSDASADALRRDFTVNALFLDPLDPGEPRGPRGGRIIDLVQGIGDLQSRVLRAVGDPEKRLAEDHLRALRAARFAARLGFVIDPATAEAIRRHAAELAGVSQERIGDELRRMFTHPTRGRAAELMQELRLESQIAPVTATTQTKPDFATLKALAPDAGFALSLAAWAIDRGVGLEEPVLLDLFRVWRASLCLSNEERDESIADLRGLRTLRETWLSLSMAGQKRAASQPWFEGAACLARATDPGRAAEIQSRVEYLKATPQGLNPAPWVTGDDLVRLGLKPGPAFKGILDEVYDAQLEGRVKNRTEAVELARTKGV